MSIRARKRVNTVVSKAAAYDKILRPIITEKATLANENGQVTFAVSIDATKPEIKAALKTLRKMRNEEGERAQAWPAGYAWSDHCLHCRYVHTVGSVVCGCG